MCSQPESECGLGLGLGLGSEGALVAGYNLEVPPKRKDYEFVQRCIRGEPGAWKDLVDLYAPAVQAVGRRYLRLLGAASESTDVEDVVQEVFMALAQQDYRLLRQYDPTYSFKTWLGVLARTHAHRLMRRRRPQTGVVEDFTRYPDSGGSALKEAERGEEQELVQKALGELEERDAKILRLRFLREMDYRAIVMALRIPETSVGQTLYRAKKKLLERLRKLLGADVLM